VKGGESRIIDGNSRYRIEEKKGIGSLQGMACLPLAQNDIEPQGGIRGTHLRDSIEARAFRALVWLKFVSRRREVKMKRTIKMAFWMVSLCVLVSLMCTVQPGLAKEKQEILIGTHMPLSGLGAFVGAEQKWAYEQAVADVNKMGGIYIKESGKKLRVRLYAIDDESDPGKAAAAVERLIKRVKVDLILSGQVGAMGVLPGMIQAEKYKKYYHGTVIWVPQFLEQNFKWATMYFFDPGQGAAMVFEVWNSLPENERPQRPGLFVEDTFDGKTIGDVMEMLGKKFGYKFAVRETMPMGAKDFTSQILKAKAANVDGAFCLANVPETVTLVRQMKENKLSFKVFQGMKGTWPSEFYDSLGKDADYILCDGFWSMDYPYPGAKELGMRYHDHYGKYSTNVGMYYAVAQTLFQAIEKAGTVDSAEVRQTVLDNTFMTVNGPVDYDEKGVALFPLGDNQWLKGKRWNIYPFNVSKYRVSAAPSWDER
jgi:branched-chain amino acid transport system substrate-binding protein